MSLKAGAAAAGTSIDARIMPHVTPELSVIVWGDGEEREDLREAYDALLVSLPSLTLKQMLTLR